MKHSLHARKVKGPLGLRLAEVKMVLDKRCGMICVCIHAQKHET